MCLSDCQSLHDYLLNPASDGGVAAMQHVTKHRAAEDAQERTMQHIDLDSLRSCTPLRADECPLDHGFQTLAGEPKRTRRLVVPAGGVLRSEMGSIGICLLRVWTH